MAHNPEHIHNKGPQSVTGSMVELKAVPIPQSPGAPISEVMAAFSHNLRVVLGGEVATVGGEVVTTYGVLGTALGGIGSRLEDIAVNERDLAAGAGQYSNRGLFRGVEAVNKLRKEHGSASKAEAETVSKAQKAVNEQKKKIRKLCKKEGITPEVVAKYDAMIVIERHLSNTGSDNLQEVHEAMTSLKWTDGDEELTRREVRLLLTGATTNARGYDQYRDLTVGKGEGANRTKGLQDYEEELSQNARLKELHDQERAAQMVNVKDQAAAWQGRNAQSRKEGIEKHTLAKNRDGALKIGDFLERRYMPNQGEVVRATERLTDTREQFRVAEGQLEEILTLVTSKPARTDYKQGVDSAIENFGAQLTRLTGVRRALVNPEDRLTQKGAPEVLTNLVKRVNTPGFDLTRVPLSERFLAEAVLVALGRKCVVRVLEAEDADIVKAEEDKGKTPEEVVQGLAEGAIKIDDTRDVVIDPKAVLVVDQLMQLLNKMRTNFSGAEDKTFMLDLLGANRQFVQGMLPDLAIEAWRRLNTLYISQHGDGSLLPAESFTELQTRFADKSNPVNAEAQGYIALIDAINQSSQDK